MSKSKLKEGDTVYIATDERDKSFFQPLKDHYDVVFLDDFHDELGHHVNTNYYGMIDQLVASRGRTFFGCWFSTFTGYINSELKSIANVVVFYVRFWRLFQFSNL
jgi:hypothetical protein